MSEGLTLAGRYRLVSKLGQGGMGSVWRAEHLTLGIPVAIKLIDPSIAQSEEALARFRREAQAAAELRSSHVVHIIDYGVDNGTPYIAMEMLEGESLAARLSRVGRLEPKEAAAILSQVARALTKAHQQSIIHRDLKPENIFIVQEGDDQLVKVLDFGIAKKLGLSSTSSGVKTHTGAMLGTPYYMSPEPAKGHAGLDHRTDIWSLGIITYECITGARPFESETLASLLVAICTEPLPVPSQVAAVPKGFDAWFARCASRDLSVRFASASEATQQLREICGWRGTGHTLETTGAVPSAEKPPAVLELVDTAVPASVTIDGLKRGRIRGLGFIVVGAVILAGLGIWAGRLLTKPNAQVTNASASPSIDQPRTSVPMNEAVIAPSNIALGSVASGASPEGPVAPVTPSAGAAALPATHSIKGASATAIPSKGGKTADSSNGTAAVPEAPSAGSPKKTTVHDAAPVRRDYDKSVGF